MKPRILAFCTLSFALFLAAATRAADTLPAQLSDAEFWKMIGDFSEPDGAFNMEIITSNEVSYQEAIPALRKTVSLGGVYIGVAPEQNFTYMSALRSHMGFIIDIRRDNMLEHLMYKALFEMSKDRLDFVSRLFSRRQPAGLTSGSSVVEIFNAFAAARPDKDYYTQNLQAIQNRLVQDHKIPLKNTDLERIRYIYNAFYTEGVTSFRVSDYSPGYTTLMTLTDGQGFNWSYLATEENFRFIQEMERKNLIVPLVADFAGPKTIRAIGQYLRDHGATTAAFYVSNVEYYIQSPATKWTAWCRNVATLPVDSSSTFIRWSQNNRGTRLASLSDFISLVKANRIPDYYSVLSMGR